MITLLQHNRVNKTQKEVDFLIPFLDLDRKYFVDPSLIRFSTTPLMVKWSQEIDDFLDLTNRIIKSGDYTKLRSLLNIGEAQNVGLGYCSDSIDGNGFGAKIADNIIRIIKKNKSFREKGFSRIEELQWLDKNIGPDRISDFAIHILKRDIIKYTQKQAKLLGLPQEEVRVQKVFMPNTLEWVPQKVSLPVNPLKISNDAVNQHPGILLIPKEIVKPLPLFLSYDDFYGFIEEQIPKSKRLTTSRMIKEKIIKRVIDDPSQSLKYIKLRESNKQKLFRPDFDKEILEHVEELEILKPGNKDAHKYRACVAKLLTYVFIDELNYYTEEKKTLLGDKQRDIIFQNISKSGIFSDFKNLHSSGHIIVDAKNTLDVTAKDISRVADYLDKNIGLVGIIMSRKKADKKLLVQARGQLDTNGKIILFICDEELKRWVRAKTKIQQISGKEQDTFDPLVGINNKYTELLSS